MDDPYMNVMVELDTCNEDHGGCLGRCDGSLKHPRLMRFQIPRSVLDLTDGVHFHISGVHNCECVEAQDMHWYLRDYDCLIAEQGHDFNAVMNRFATKLAEQITRTRESTQQPVRA